MAFRSPVVHVAGKLRTHDRCAAPATPDCADAEDNLAGLLQRLARHAESAAHWRRYLGLDRDTPWAARARRALKFLRDGGQSEGLRGECPWVWHVHLDIFSKIKNQR